MSILSTAGLLVKEQDWDPDGTEFEPSRLNPGSVNEYQGYSF